jgi:transglutaminase-like putative cysteine protease
MIKIRVGYDLVYDCPQPTPMVLMLNIHHERAGDILEPDRMVAEPSLPVTPYRDSFGNWCSRILAPAGRLRLSSSALLKDSGEPDPVPQAEFQHAVEDLPEESIVFLLGSRYCETDRLTDIAWNLFGGAPTGARRVQAICDYVHQHITFNYQNARATRTAWEALQERTGVCRDYAHLAIAFCRCMNIPARYCTGYLGDIGIPPPYGPMDFAAWFEAYIGGRWYTFDPRNNVPRIGRVLIARGRDATDVAISNTFGPTTLSGFTVCADEVRDPSENAGPGDPGGAKCAS